MVFLQRVFDLWVDLEIDEGNIQRFLKPQNPLNHIEITTNLNLAQPTPESQSPRESLKILALEAIHTIYPELDWSHIYTNKYVTRTNYSMTEQSSVVGSGIYSFIFLFMFL
ncbi:hypothetical protein CEXT_633791 [Caerostris extrusa]|uniref:Uncharacterized protein n=1 Tax=Caerostris extrusa TaxID=172846 RepID=A0AAV4UPP6_CAEEX|nr:hypothetical protein CEXT_633791 [Caerostris extrusa]